MTESAASSRISRRLVPILAIAFASVTLPLAGYHPLAQNETAALSGAVYDATGAVLPAVDVTLEDAQHRISRAKSDASGRFRFAPLAPGTYKLEASQMGFKSLQQNLDLGRAVEWIQPITMQVGTLQETISVAERRPARPEPARATSGPVRIGGNIRTPKKLAHVSPVYPPAMRDAGLEGVVPLEALIGRDGNVASVRIVSALVHPEFAKAAVEAVRQWRFDPTLLNGEAIEVAMTVTIRFSLSD